MKNIIVPKSGQRGSVLLVSLVITFIIGLTLASYLIMTQSQNVSVARSQTWNASIALSEAGVEDALAMLNKNGGNFDTIYYWTNSSSLNADGWQTLAGNVYHTRRYLGSNYYDSYITSAPQSFFAAAGAGSSTPAVIVRQLEVRTKLEPLFNVAMAAIKAIDFNGKRVGTDSFDSADQNYSDPGGLYPADVNKTKAGGDVVTDDIIIGALNVGEAKIKGVAKTGPKGTIDIGSNGSVGDRAWVEGGNTGIQTGHSADDMNVIFDPVSLPTLPTPAAGWPSPYWWMKNVSVNGTVYDYVFLISGDYKLRTRPTFISSDSPLAPASLLTAMALSPAWCTRPKQTFRSAAAALTPTTLSAPASPRRST